MEGVRLMKYYELNGNTKTFFMEGAVEITSPIREDGTVLPKHDNDAMVQRDENGDYYPWYNQDGTPDMVKIEKDIQDALIVKVYEDKNKALDELVINHNTVMFDANGKAIGNMSAVMGIANFKFNQAVAQGASSSDAYTAIYKSTISWRGADNKPHEVQIESICQALEKSMMSVSDILGL